MDLFVTMLPYLMLSLVFAIPNYFLARRVRTSPIVWFVLSLIPVINVFFFWYVWYFTAFYILDRLNPIAAKLGVQEEPRR